MGEVRERADVDVVGRDSELEVVRAFVAADAPARALVLTGGPGIGKTTLWEAGLAAARERGLRVLLARPSAAEAQASFAALIDLFDGVETGPRPMRSRSPPPGSRARSSGSCSPGARVVRPRSNGLSSAKSRTASRSAR